MLPVLIAAGILGAVIGVALSKAGDLQKIAKGKKVNISNNNVAICMLGPRAVGKTSLLTSMYEQFKDKSKELNLQLTSDIETREILDEYLKNLKNLFNNSNDIFQCDAFYIREGKRIYTFKLGKSDKVPSLQLNFIDYMGNYLQSEQDFVLDIVIKSQVILIAIDTPALMEKNGIYNDLINKPDLVKNFFAKGQDKINQPRLIIFAPIKCEKYIPERSKEMVDKIKNSYRRLLDIFSSDALKDKIAAVITPVQTLGNIRFAKYEIKNGIACPYFTKTNNDYSPVDTEQPLFYLLKFLLNLHLDYRSVSWNLFSFLRDFFGEDEHLKDAIEKISGECKKNRDGFEILQGHRWL